MGIIHDDWTLCTDGMIAPIGIRLLKTSVYLATLRTRTAAIQFLTQRINIFEGSVHDWCASSV